jgi:hypothetical protein
MQSPFPQGRCEFETILVPDELRNFSVCMIEFLGVLWEIDAPTGGLG